MDVIIEFNITIEHDTNAAVVTRERIEPTFSGSSSARFVFFFLKAGSSSVRFDFIFEKSVRVRFGSTRFSKSRFEFGSVRFVFALCCVHPKSLLC